MHSSSQICSFSHGKWHETAAQQKVKMFYTSYFFFNDPHEPNLISFSPRCLRGPLQALGLWRILYFAQGLSRSISSHINIMKSEVFQVYNTEIYSCSRESDFSDYKFSHRVYFFCIFGLTNRSKIVISVFFPLKKCLETSRDSWLRCTWPPLPLLRWEGVAAGWGHG